MSTQDEIKYWKSLLAKKDDVANLTINVALSHIAVDAELSLSKTEIATLKAIIAQMSEALKACEPWVAECHVSEVVRAALEAAGSA